MTEMLIQMPVSITEVNDILVRDKDAYAIEAAHGALEERAQSWLVSSSLLLGRKNQ